MILRVEKGIKKTSFLDHRDADKCAVFCFRVLCFTVLFSVVLRLDVPLQGANNLSSDIFNNGLTREREEG